MKITLLLGLSLVFLVSCRKDVNKTDFAGPGESNPATLSATSLTAFPAAPPIGVYTTYTISAGQHFSDLNIARATLLSNMKFVARFNNSAKYTTANPINQADINMLYGFSEGPDHLWNSARIGWNWYNGALRLYAYVYQNGLRRTKYITAAAIGSEVSCKISFEGYTPATSYYVFNVNGVIVKVPRANFTSITTGYQLYPYFGGTEVAPHNITIDIKNM